MTQSYRNVSHSENFQENWFQKVSKPKAGIRKWFGIVFTLIQFNIREFREQFTFKLFKPFSSIKIIVCRNKRSISKVRYKKRITFM